MSLRVHPIICGYLTSSLRDVIEGGVGDVRAPVPAYLIEHSMGTLLFDTGMHPDCQVDPVGRVGQRLGMAYKFHFRPGEEISTRLVALGRDPTRIDLIINSHLHFDHAGGNAQIPNATLLLQKREWEAAKNPELAALYGFNRCDFELGHKVRKIDGEYDVFGDGRVVCLPTHGHTPGHQSLMLRLDSGDIVLAADACQFCRTLSERRLPVRVLDRAAMNASLERLARLQTCGARIFFGHDPDFWADVMQTPMPII